MINAATIHAQAMQAASLAPVISPRRTLALSSEYQAAPEFEREEMMRVLELTAPPAYITLQTATGHYKIHNTRERLEKFAAMIKTNARLFGGGFAKPEKKSIGVVWPAQLVRTVSECLQTKDFAGALQLAEERLGALFFMGKEGKGIMVYAPVPVDGLPACMASVRIASGQYTVTHLVSGAAMGDAARTRDAAVTQAMRLVNCKDEAGRDALWVTMANQKDATAGARSAWMTNNGIEDAQSIADRIESEALAREEEKTLGERFDEERAKRRAERDAIAAELARLAEFDVAQALRDAETNAKIETQRIEREAETARGLALVARMDAERAARDVAQVLAQAAQDEGREVISTYAETLQKIAVRVKIIGYDKARREVESARMGATLARQFGESIKNFWVREPKMKARDEAREFWLNDHATQMAAYTETHTAQEVARAKDDTRELATCEAGEASGTTQATRAPAIFGAGSAPAATFQGGESSGPGAPVATFGAAPAPTVATFGNYSDDIPLSLAVSAHSGTSFSPERRGANAQKDYAQGMGADFAAMQAQAIRGGTLDILGEVFDKYRARQSGAYRAYLASSSRCVSSFIAGPANFPAARMNKRADISNRRLTEYLDGGKMALQAAIRTLRPDLRAIMAGDADAVDRLTVKIAQAERAQDVMKAANKAIKATAKQGEPQQVAALMELGINELDAVELLHPRFSRRQGFAPYSLTNNNANIRRMRERLESISKAQACEVVAVECTSGVTLEDDAPANRVRLYFPGKPSEEIRTDLKSNGFRWAPSVGAWQAYRNHGTLATAQRLAGEPVQPDDTTQAAPETEATQEAPGETIAPTLATAPSTPSAEFLEAPTPPVATFDAPAPPAVEAEAKAAPFNPLIDFEAGDDGITCELADAISTATPAQVQTLTGAQFERLYDHLENWNFHTECILINCLQAGRLDLAGRTLAVMADYEVAGHMSAPLMALRSAISQELRGEPAGGVIMTAQAPPAGQQVKSKSGRWSALLAMMIYQYGFTLEFTTPRLRTVTNYPTARERMAALQALARAADAPDDTPPDGYLDGLATLTRQDVADTPATPSVQKTGTPCTPVATFERVQPVRIDLADMVVQGVKPEALIGLGVDYRGDMANPAAAGAITATGQDWRGLTVEVTLESGSVWRSVQSTEFLTGKFSLNAKFHGAPYLAQLAGAVAALKASASSAKDQAAKLRAESLVTLAAQFPQLKRAASTHEGGKLAAVNIRTLIKAAFKGVKFGVTSSYNSVRVTWTDGPTDKQVNEVIGRFDIGRSDPQTDYFDTVSTAFSDLFGGVQYLNTSRENSDALVNRVIEQMYPDASIRPTAQDWRKGAGIFSLSSPDREMREMRRAIDATEGAKI